MNRSIRQPLVPLAGLAGALYVWGASRGDTHYYYAAAVRTMAGNWRDFVFGALDPAGSITVDKTPGALWVQALLVRLFGMHTWLLLAPGTLAATASVPLLYATVCRWAGGRAALFAVARVNLPDIQRSGRCW